MGGQLSNNQHDHLWEEELDLAETLKELCDQHGKEKTPKESAIILNQMGLLYKKRSPDKLSLIRSAVLLNAAVARQPNNEAFNKDLDTFCSEILQVSGATQTEADLMELSNGVAEKVKLMRDNTNTSLQSITNLSYDITDDQLKEHKSNLIEEVQSIQNEITESYTSIMKFISANCEEIMGKPPCKYAVTGMGSLARKEITPYSDFEHIILLEEGIQNNKNKYARALNYFRWFSMIFHVIIINLKETIIPCVTIPSLNDPSKPNGYWFFDSNKPRGVSFDGLIPHACKLPLGRMEKTKKKPWTTELIRPVSDMLRYLDSRIDLKNGYKICDVLLKTCFVFGDELLYKDFAGQVKTILELNKSYYKPQMMKQLYKDLENFDAFKNLKRFSTTSNCNIKRVVYRSTSLFICALGRIHSIEEASSFSIINCLRDKEAIVNETAFQLSYAVAIACLSRLKVYMLKQSQDDIVGDNKVYDTRDNELTSEMISILGERNMIDYFIIADVLQRDIRKNIDNLHDMQVNISPEPEVKFLILNVFGLHDRIISEWKKYLKSKSTIVLFRHDYRIQYCVANAYYWKKQYHESLIICEQIERLDGVGSRLKGLVMTNKLWCLQKLGRYQEGVLYTEKAMQKVASWSVSEGQKSNVMSILTRVNGDCKYSMGLYYEASFAYRKTLEYYKQSDASDNESRKADCLYRIGCCLSRLCEYETAIIEANNSLSVCQQRNIPVSIKCDCYKLLGLCYLEKLEYNKAFENYKEELALRLRFVPKENHNSDAKIQCARLNIQRCEEAMAI